MKPRVEDSTDVANVVENGRVSILKQQNQWYDSQEIYVSFICTVYFRLCPASSAPPHSALLKMLAYVTSMYSLLQAEAEARKAAESVNLLPDWICDPDTNSSEEPFLQGINVAFCNLLLTYGVTSELQGTFWHPGRGVSLRSNAQRRSLQHCWVCATFI